MALFPRAEEVRSSLANPEKWLIDLINGGSESKAGVKVDRDTAMNNSAFFDGVRILANALMVMPLILYKRKAGGGRERAVKHPMYRIAHAMANPRMSAPRFRQTGMGHLAPQGNFYSQVDMARGGYVKGLYPLRPEKVITETKGGKLKYRHKNNSGADYEFKDWEMFHIPGFGYDGIKGYSLITLAREGIGMGLAMEEFGGRFFSNGARPSAIVEYPGKVSEKAYDKYKKDIKNKHEGLGKSHDTMFLEEGFKYHQVSLSQEDSQYLESRKFQTIEIARWLNLPPYMMKHTDAERITNMEHRGIELIQDSYLPWLVLWETEFTRMFLSEKEQEEYYFEFLVDGLLRADTKSRNESYQMMRRNGIISANEWREKENMNPIEGDEGKQRLIPVNMMPADKAGDFYGGKTVNGDNKARSEDQKGHEHRAPTENNSMPIEVRAVARNRLAANFYGLFVDAAQRIGWRERKELERLTAKHTAGRSVDSGQKGHEHRAPTETRDENPLEGALEEFYGDFGDYVSRQLKPVISSYGDEIYKAAADEVDGDESTDEEKQEYTEGYNRRTVTRYTDSSLGQLREIIRETKEDELNDAIEARLDEWEEKRPDKVATRETGDGRSAFASMVFLAGGFDLIWRTQGKSCPYCMMLDGKRIGRTGSFVDAGDTVDPGDDEHKPMKIYETKRHPQLHGGCDCIVVAG